MNLLQIYEPGQTPLPHQDALAVGIDLGTTHSVVAIGSSDGVEVVHNIHGHALVPSVVYYSEDGGVEVGYPARARYEQGKHGVIASVKRLMGRGAEDIRPLLGNAPHEIVPSLRSSGASADKPSVGMAKIKAGNREVTPVEVSAEILKHLKALAGQALGREVTKAVITVPAYFDDAARTATKDAGRLAGLEVLRLINEPTAAALAYGLDKGAEGVYAVYDLGGGTFDISLLKLEQGVFQVLSTGGDTQLGGDDFDAAIAAWLLGELGIGEESLNPASVGQLVSLAREAKHKLTDNATAEITYRGKMVTLRRKDFDELILDYVERTVAVCGQALTDAKLSIADVKGVVMVGGATRIPLVINKVREFFGKQPLTDVNPDEVVAMGAAIQARALTQGGDHLLLDVIPLSLGLETMGGLTEKIMYRNSPIPATVSQEFTTWQDGQTGMQIHVVQGEREKVEHNRSLAKFELKGIPPLPAGIARVRVTFTVDADGLLTVSAEEKTTGAKQEVAVSPAYGIAPEDMERMLRESMERAEEDITGRLLTEARLDAERMVIELESAMKRDAGLLEEAEKKRLERQIQVVKNAASGADRDYIGVEAAELSRLAAAFAQRRMDKAIGSALKGKQLDKVAGSS